MAGTRGVAVAFATPSVQRLAPCRRFAVSAQDTFALVEIAPFRGIRFDSSRSGPIGPLIAPPYDVAADPVNGTSHSISAIENADLGQPGDQHGLAARRYQEWLDAGLLRRDPAPAFYVHRHRFLDHGVPRERVGLLARVRLHDWHERVVLPHEATVPGPRMERLARLQAVGANLSPLYFLYRDPDREIGELIGALTASAGASEEIDRRGGTHQVEMLTDPMAQRRMADLFAARTLFVADGHHRYEAALAYRDQQRQRYPGQDGPWEYVLALLAAVEDPGVIVWPTHRVIAGAAAGVDGELRMLLGRWFALRPVLYGSQAENGELFRVATARSETLLAVSAQPGNPHRALQAGGKRESWQSLGVSAVESVLESVLGANLLARPDRVARVVDAEDAINKVARGQASTAFLLPPPSLGQLLAVAEEGDLLPPKSSWFEPKAPAGLVINDLERSKTE